MGWSKRAPKKRSPIPVYSAPDDHAEAAARHRAAEELAVRIGWCTACGEHVDEEHGKLHDQWCPVVPPERRRSRA